jgi:hypothetical protein
MMTVALILRVSGAIPTLRQAVFLDAPISIHGEIRQVRIFADVRRRGLI